jgi:hypothetical protein
MNDQGLSWEAKQADDLEAFEAEIGTVWRLAAWTALRVLGVLGLCALVLELLSR